MSQIHFRLNGTDQVDPCVNEAHVYLHMPDPSVRAALSDDWLTAFTLGKQSKFSHASVLAPIQGLWWWLGHYGAGRFQLRPRFQSKSWSQNELDKMLAVVRNVAMNPLFAPQTISIEMSLRMDTGVRRTIHWDNDSKSFISHDSASASVHQEMPVA